MESSIVKEGTSESKTYQLPPLRPLVRDWKNPTPEELEAQREWDRKYQKQLEKINHLAQ